MNKKDMYRVIMEQFVEMYDECSEHFNIIKTVDTDAKWNRHCIYSILSASGACVSSYSMQLDDFITSLAHILAEERQLCLEDESICFSEESNYEDWSGIPAV